MLTVSKCTVFLLKTGQEMSANDLLDVLALRTSSPIVRATHALRARKPGIDTDLS